jgi:hypothetical protein
LYAWCDELEIGQVTASLLSLTTYNARKKVGVYSYFVWVIVLVIVVVAKRIRVAAI